MNYHYLEVRREHGVEHLTINRPDVRNALNSDVIGELTAWAADTRQDPAVRVVVLAGAGATFCAGADIAWMARSLTYTTDENLREATAISEMFGALDTLPVPLVCRIQGAALGGGCGLAAVSDIVVCEHEAIFGFTETRLGILPAAISPFAIAKIGVSAARELFLTGMRFDAKRAQAIGLVHEAVAIGDLDRTVQQYVRELLAASPAAIARAKALIPQVAGRAPADVRALTARAIAEQRVSPEGQEGLRAFIEKRKASWVSDRP